MRAQTPRPPEVDDVDQVRARHTPLLVWWLAVGLAHGLTRGPVGDRLTSLVLLLLVPLAAPLLLVAQLVVIRLPTGRFYLARDRSAVLRIAADPHGWHVVDHMSRHPGTGAGKALRQAVSPRLLEVADQRAVTVRTTAATERLAQVYRQEFPGLVDVGPGRLRGRRLERSPQQHTRR